ncbi:hypothetical protein WOLCODRAFT_116605 [Wolfiporia cocos MD-104 SS10]|uniref:NudC domain-containing protein 1 n=1 Tax=Wolfiporia cocos (strain MD-104) TaxID=742152 RepID=A0A2H3JQQ5_WOLCO|nr:hypothetical protein WOLCODRAFT_116605 [Wolfiporia cocos MD-104 SS10]
MFQLNRALLNPRFDGYKLSPLEQDHVVFRYALPYKASQTNVSGRSHVSFQEVQSRISHNHLLVSAQGERAVFIDSELRVVSVILKEDTLEPAFSVLCELPKPITTPEAGPLQPEYPSAAYLDKTSLFASDGHGHLYALRISEYGTAEVIGTFELLIPLAYGSSERNVPFRIHQAVQTSTGTAVVILSSKFYSSDSSRVTSASRRQTKSTPAQFDIWAVQVPLPSSPTDEQLRALEILWHRRGSDIPVYTSFDAGRQSFLLAGSSYKPLDAAPMPSYEPSTDELVPIPRVNENLDGATPKKPPPYSWTQTSDSVTVAIPLPASTRTEDIQVAFSPRTLTVRVRTPPDANAPVKPPQYDMKQLWDGITPSASLWTWDRTAEHAYGVLTLHLDKTHEGTRWAQVFAGAGASASADAREEDVEVPETLDPSELWAIREALEKYTAALRDGEDASGLGLGRGVPSLAKDEVDEEVDVSVGRSVCVTWVRVDGTQPPYDETGVQLLSAPIPGSGETSVVLRNGIDGVLYELNTARIPEDAPAWTHSATYSALSFVLASKRDARFTYHVSSKAVLAFESGSWDLGGNVYIYRGAPPKEKWAKQAVLKVGGGSAGSLLGVGAVQLFSKTIMICLCEQELVVLRDVV